MNHKQAWHALPLLSLIIVLALYGCSPLLQQTAAIQPTPVPVETAEPVETVEPGGVDNPDVYVDPAAFRSALLEALTARDSEKLLMWMTEPFLTGGWRADASDTPPADALKSLYDDQLGTEIQLAVVPDVDLKALMDGQDLLSIPRPEAGVIDAFLVSGWGKDGRDEAVLFVARQADNSLKWQGWMQVKGGFSGTRIGGAQYYQNDELGFGLYAPKTYNITVPGDGTVTIFGPEGKGGHPGFAYIKVEAANGLTSEQAVQRAIEDNKVVMGPEWQVPVPMFLGMGGEMAFVIDGLPGQDINRQLFVVHNDRLYFMMFSPSQPQTGDPYWQMEDAYAMVTNTFRFLD